MSAIHYAELHCQSNFSFLTGASHPEELVARAQELGYCALAVTDECSVAGVVRAHEQARACGLKLIVGSEIRLDAGPVLVLLAEDLAGYGALCRLITRGRRRAAKSTYRLTRDDLVDGLPGCLALLVPQWPALPTADELDWFGGVFGHRGWLALELLRRGDDAEWQARLAELGQHFRLPLVAAGAVQMHRRSRRPLRDLVTAIRLRQPVHALGQVLEANGERHLRSRFDLAQCYPAAALDESVRIAERCRFSLDEIRYQYPDDVTPPDLSPCEYLARLTETGKEQRWPDGCPPQVERQIRHELDLIAELEYEAFFLTVWDIVRFARARNILCQGRGSAANSAVCYCLGITEVDPARMNLLFERFISRERGEPPDIDVDFEHERREEVIQYIYEKYGRERAALAATLITYRPKSALRDTGKAMGLSPEQVEQLSKAVSGWRRWRDIRPEYLREAGFDPDNPRIVRVLHLANELLGFPRHLSQHVGGFVIARDHLPSLVPVENATMPERTVIQWDKDDLESLGLLKVDVLGLGMLSAIRCAFDLIAGYRGTRWQLATLPAEDPAVYRMICRADTVGVFQIESRAQMSMLPRLKPKNFYDLVIEIAIVRPGPIQGDMVHPYLRRRQGQEPVDYPSDEVRAVLERTLGVPIFQEQVIKLAMVAAGFSPGEADQLRRSMAAWRRRGGLEPYRRRLVSGMHARGYPVEFAERVYQQILGFGEYGFPESHSASFALLAYASSWLKCHEPAAFCAALINSQPMGFYQPAQLVRDAREHGVEARTVDIRYSDWDCTLERYDPAGRSRRPATMDVDPPATKFGEPGGSGQPALRLGLRLVHGLSRAGAQRLVAARSARAFRDIDDLARRACLSRDDLEALSAADALVGLAGHRHQAWWQVAGVEAELPLLAAGAVREVRPALDPPSRGRQVVADYRSLGLSLRQHPLALLRSRLDARGLMSSAQIAARAAGDWVRVAGLVLIRQRPGKGRAVFVTLEDETGISNLIIWARLAERQRQVLLGARLLGALAEIQRADGVQHLVCRRLEDHSALLVDLKLKSRDFH